MRVFFKALASVGMIVLSTAAAIGIRHLVRNRRNRHDNQPNPDTVPASQTEENASQTEENASQTENPSEEVPEHPDDSQAETQEEAEPKD